MKRIPYGVGVGNFLDHTMMTTMMMTTITTTPMMVVKMIMMLMMMKMMMTTMVMQEDADDYNECYMHRHALEGACQSATILSS